MTKYDVRFWLWALIAIGVALYIGMRLTDDGRPYYQMRAERAANDCIRNKGYGAWVGSSGVSLEQFCNIAGNAKALDEHRRDHPENY